jgi:MFS family permease
MTVPASRLVDRHRERLVLGGGLVTFGAGIAVTTILTDAQASPLTFTPWMIAGGLGLGCLIAPVTAIGLRHVERERVGTAGGVLNTTRETAALLGTAVIGALIQHGLMNEVRASVLREPALDRACVEATLTVRGQAVGLGRSRGSLPPECTEEALRHAHDLFARAYISSQSRATMLIVGLLLVAAATVFAMLRSTSADAATRHQGPR